MDNEILAIGRFRNTLPDLRDKNEYFNLGQVESLLGLSWTPIKRMIKFLKIETKLGVKNSKNIVGHDLIRLNQLKRIEVEDRACREHILSTLKITDKQLEDFMQTLRIKFWVDQSRKNAGQDQHSFVSHDDYRRIRELRFSKGEENEDHQAPQIDVLTTQQTAELTGFTELELEQLHKNSDFNVGIKIHENYPLLWSQKCLDKLQELKEKEKAAAAQEKISADKQLLLESKLSAEIKQVLHKELDNYISNNFSPMISKLGNTLSALETQIAECIEAHHDYVKRALELQTTKLNDVEERLQSQTEQLVNILDWSSDPDSDIANIRRILETNNPNAKKIQLPLPITELEDCPDNKGQGWYPEEDEPLKAPETWEEVNYSLTKSKPDMVRFSSATPESIRQALDYYKMFVDKGQIQDKQIHKLTEHAKFIQNRLKKHFTKDFRGMSMTDYHSISLKGQGFPSNIRHIVQYAALGLIFEWGNLEIVLGKAGNGRPPRFLYHKEDYQQMKEYRESKGLSMPHGEDEK